MTSESLMPLELHADGHWLATLAFGGPLRMCGCHEPLVVLRGLADMVDLFHEKPREWAEREDALQRVAGPLWSYVAYQLDEAKLIEHGGGIGGAWTTDLGLKFVRIVSGSDDDLLERMLDSGYSCSPGCPAGSVWGPGDPPVAGAGPWAHLPIGSEVPDA